MPELKMRPVAVCTDCITYAFDIREIGSHCKVLRGTHACAGTLVDAIDPINWKECTACAGTGTAWDGEQCRACQESGWLLTRRR